MHPYPHPPRAITLRRHQKAVSSGVTLEGGKNYGLCWSLDHSHGIFALEVDINGSLDVASATGGKAEVTLGAAVSGENRLHDSRECGAPSRPPRSA